MENFKVFFSWLTCYPWKVPKDHVTALDWSPVNFTLATGGWDRRCGPGLVRVRDGTVGGIPGVGCISVVRWDGFFKKKGDDMYDIQRCI